MHKTSGIGFTHWSISIHSELCRLRSPLMTQVSPEDTNCCAWFLSPVVAIEGCTYVPFQRYILVRASGTYVPLERIKRKWYQLLCVRSRSTYVHPSMATAGDTNQAQQLATSGDTCRCQWWPMGHHWWWPRCHQRLPTVRKNKCRFMREHLPCIGLEGELFSYSSMPLSCLSFHISHKQNVSSMLFYIFVRSNGGNEAEAPRVTFGVSTSWE